MAGGTAVTVLTALMTLSCIAGHWEQTHPKCFFSYPSPLPNADCSHLNLSAVPQTLPSNLYKLDLSYNGIVTITDVSFVRYRKVQILLLRQNALNRIEGKSFELLQDLRVLYMSYNDISRLPDALFHKNFRLSHLDLTETDRDPKRRSWLVNLPLEAFHPDDFCGINVPLILGLILGSIMVTLLGLLILTRKRWWLNYKIFVLKRFVLGYKQHEADRQADDYEYQLNIMYHDNDDDWVHDVLRPALEERMPHLQRVAYGNDALRVSMYYIDAIYHIVENSYKTVLLLSNQCTDDAWFITKVRVALEHVNETGLDKVILVFLEDIPDERLPYLHPVRAGDVQLSLQQPVYVRQAHKTVKQLPHPVLPGPNYGC
ncbi:toll-like receptor 3 [Diadema antillarum]|uniref:toll-like receptor 3 n=1 Tax=Diadema antillarum TaxID=105358 RepID=UPI003A8A8099